MEADDYLVFLLSGANLGRYNVSPQSLCAALQSDDEVTGHAIFVAEPVPQSGLRLKCLLDVDSLLWMLLHLSRR